MPSTSALPRFPYQPFAAARVRASSSQSSFVSGCVVNELLTSLVRFRDRSGRLLVCATNSVRDLDTASLRHGRFDYVLPIGLPRRSCARSAG